MTRAPIKVSSYSGYKADERPTRFTYKGKIYNVKEILSSSLEQSTSGELRRRFTIKTDDGLLFNIHYDERDKLWFMEE
ncbi:MAG: hypothetical protein HYW14_00625 [Planctomycetes bacterium]|nr:hypothetical protein [Planctomycetota bacterium]MBI4008527.1 hypothetical protein [Planctomycetota bacterium]